MHCVPSTFRNLPHSTVKKSDVINDEPSPFFNGTGLSYLCLHGGFWAVILVKGWFIMGDKDETESLTKWDRKSRKFVVHFPIVVDEYIRFS